MKDKTGRELFVGDSVGFNNPRYDGYIESGQITGFTDDGVILNVCHGRGHTINPITKKSQKPIIIMAEKAVKYEKGELLYVLFNGGSNKNEK